MKNLLVLLSILFVSSTLQASEVAGKTMLARGQVKALSADLGQQRKLKRRAPIFADDLVETGAKAKAQLRMTDGGMIALKENSQLQVASYQYSAEDGKGSMVLELVKGGLRSVTGAIKSDTGDYQLKTPVGSIGIRGTHFELELVGGQLFLAVWDGAIDVLVTNGSRAGEMLSYGEGEDFSYAAIDEEGNVTEFLEPPETFDSGMSSDPDEQDEQEEQASTDESEQGSEQGSEQEAETSVVSTSDDTSSESDNEVADTSGSASEETVSVAPSDDVSDDTESVAGVKDVVNLSQSIENITTALDQDEAYPTKEDFDTVEPSSIEELLADRSGSFTYQNVTSFSGTSGGANISNFQMFMAIDFDDMGVTGGDMTFDDASAQWRANFSGTIATNGDFNLSISHASHGNNLATGDIDANFLGDLDSIAGSFNLNEISNPSVQASGKFIVE